MRKANPWVKALTHPVVDPMHFGSETALDCDESFPNAHEPHFIHVGMGAAADPTFWPTFNLDTTATAPAVTNLAGPLHAHLATYLATRPWHHMTRQAERWRDVIKSSGNREIADGAADLFNDATRLMSEAEASGVRSDRLKRSLAVAREAMRSQGYTSKKSGATASFFSNALGALALEQLHLDLV